MITFLSRDILAQGSTANCKVYVLELYFYDREEFGGISIDDTLGYFTMDCLWGRLNHQKYRREAAFTYAYNISIIAEKRDTKMASLFRDGYFVPGAVTRNLINNTLGKNIKNEKAMPINHTRKLQI